MDHVAIMSSDEWIDKIISGEKTIESRWTKNKISPFERIARGDRIYFKVSGKPVSAVATASEACFYLLTPAKARELLQKHCKQIGTDLSYYEKIKDKKYCTLIKIKEARRITPFGINKKGFGNSVAWLSVENINKIRI